MSYCAIHGYGALASCPECLTEKAHLTPPPKEESVVLEGDCAELGEMIAEAAFPSIPSGPVRITISPLKENGTEPNSTNGEPAG